MKLASIACVLVVIFCLADSIPVKVEWLKSTAPQDSIFTNCTSSSDEGVINSVNISPAAPKRGDTVTIEASFMLKENVTSGSIKVEAKADGIKLYSGTLDLCTTIEQIDLKCPLPAGPHTVKVTTPEIPGIAPPGTYVADGTVTDQNGKEVACAMAKYKLPL